MLLDWFFLAFILLNVFIFLYALWQCAFRNNPFGRCHLAILGSFVWGDAVIFSLFWVGLSGLTYFFVRNINFFIFSTAVFFAVRGFGEVVYWLNQQFSKINRNPPENFLIERIFPGESVWFAYQIFWQVVIVVSVIFAVYFGFRWLG